MSPLQQVFSTRLTRLFNIPHPVMLAGYLLTVFKVHLFSAALLFPTGMNVASGPRLAAAVTNAGVSVLALKVLHAQPLRRWDRCYWRLSL
jgi:hypothetical protein